MPHLFKSTLSTSVRIRAASYGQEMQRLFERVNNDRELLCIRLKCHYELVNTCVSLIHTIRYNNWPVPDSLLAYGPHTPIRTEEEMLKSARQIMQGVRDFAPSWGICASDWAVTN